MSSVSVNTKMLTDSRKAKAGVWKKSSSVVQMASAPPMIAVWRTTMSFGSRIGATSAGSGRTIVATDLQEHHVVVDPAFGHTVPGKHPGVTEHSRSLGEDLVGHDKDVIPFQDRKEQAPGKASAVGKSLDEDGRIQGDLHR